MSGKTIQTVWEIATYDVWGNSKEGFEVNNVYRNGEIAIRCKPERYNIGTEREFVSCGPSDYQIKKVFGTRSRIDTDGDDLVIYVSRSKDCYPIGELRCVSHSSLSPIKPL